MTALRKNVERYKQQKGIKKDSDQGIRGGERTNI